VPLARPVCGPPDRWIGWTKSGLICVSRGVDALPEALQIGLAANQGCGEAGRSLHQHVRASEADGCDQAVPCTRPERDPTVIISAHPASVQIAYSRYPASAQIHH